jgi:hypothetical protein
MAGIQAASAKVFLEIVTSKKGSQFFSGRTRTTGLIAIFIPGEGVV